MKFESNFDEVTGISTVHLRTPIGIFTGIAKMAEEDRPYISKYTGCGIAELRANIAYFKELLKRRKCEARGMKQVFSAISSSIVATDSGDLLRAAAIAYNNYSSKLKEIDEIKKVIARIEAVIQKSISDRDQYIQEHKAKVNTPKTDCE